MQKRQGLGAWLVKKSTTSSPVKGEPLKTSPSPKSISTGEAENRFPVNQPDINPQKTKEMSTPPRPKVTGKAKARPKARSPKKTAIPICTPKDDEASDEESVFSPSSSGRSSGGDSALDGPSSSPIVADDPSPSSSSQSPLAANPRKRAASKPLTPPRTKKRQSTKIPAEKSSFAMEKTHYVSASSIDGLAVVFTGVFESMTRSDIENQAKSLGVLVRSAVSGNTDYLVHGSQLEDGRGFDEGSKYRTALSIVNGQKKGKVTILNEEEWLKKITETESRSPTGMNDPETHSEKPTASNPTKSIAAPTASAGNATTSTIPPTLTMMWVDKYRPKIPSDVLGNRPMVNKLQEWLTDWHDVCLLGRDKVPEGKPRWRGGGGFPETERINARACMISGPPGIGKTSTAIAVARALGFSINEFNASDNRAAGDLNKIDFLTQAGRTLFDMNYFVTKSDKASTDKTVIIFDEMDGLSAGDRGGANALGRLIEKTRVPIICICNDRYSQKVKALSNKCLDLKFNRPSVVEIQKRLSIILGMEGYSIEANALLSIIQGANNDIRSCLNELQSIFQSRSSCGASATVRFNDLQSDKAIGRKDEGTLSKSPFEICRELLNPSKMTYRQREELFFIDHDLVPKLISQNYISASAGLGGFGPPRASTASPEQELKQLNAIAKGARMIAKGDQVNSKIWASQAWGLLPDVAFYGAVGPSFICAKSLMRPDFPSYMGKLSTRNKSRRLLKELTLALNIVRLNVTVPQLRTSGLLDTLYSKALDPLLKGKDPKDVLSEFAKLGITRALLVENIIPLRLKNQDQIYECVDSKMRSALTRMENASSKDLVKAPNMVQSEDNGEGVDIDAAFKEKKAAAVKAKKLAKAKAKAKGRGKAKASTKSPAKRKT